MQDTLNSQEAELREIPSVTQSVKAPTPDSISSAEDLQHSKSFKSLRSLRALQKDKLWKKSGSFSSVESSTFVDNDSDNASNTSRDLRKRLFPSNMPVVMLKELQPSWTNFLEQYGSGESNLSVVEQPVCFHGLGFMAPPDYKHEAKRIYQARRAMESKIWKKKNSDLQEAAKQIIRLYGVESLTITIVDRTIQYVVFGINPKIPDLPRNVSIDGHAILSKQCFLTLDALKDWRFAYNPTVFGPPFVRFYAGVAIQVNDSPIGVVSVMDSKDRETVPHGLIKILSKFAQKVSARLASAQEATGDLTSAWPPQKEVDSIEEELKSLQTNGIGSKIQALKKLNCNETLAKSHAISQKIVEFKDVRSAFSFACGDVCSHSNLDFAYIVEIRITNSYYVPKKEMVRYANGVYCNEIEDLDELLGKKVESKIKTRILGSHNLPTDDLELDEPVHRSALNSTYGVSFLGEK